jgi:hypothetical protein
VNALLGDTNIYLEGEFGFTEPGVDSWAKVYVLNPRNGRWAAMDLYEEKIAGGDFMSTTCVDLTDTYSCVPTLGVKAGDTLLAFYQDPSNHSDGAMISIKVQKGGNTTPSTSSTVLFVDQSGVSVVSYQDDALVYVKVVDKSHSGATLEDAITIDGDTYDVSLKDAATGTYMSAALSIDLVGLSSLAVAYKDPDDANDTANDTVNIVASELDITAFFAGPNPFAGSVTFAYEGSGTAQTFAVRIYDLAGQLVWEETGANTTEVVWTGEDEDGQMLANGAYIYVITAKDGTNTFDQSNTDSAKGLVFINR